MKCMVLIKKTLKNWLGTLSFQTYRKSSVKLYGYHDLLLKTYFEISDTGNLQLLVINGKPTEEQLLEAWEDVIRISGEKSGSYRYNSYLTLIREYGKLTAKHLMVSNRLIKLTYQHSDEDVAEVASMGYFIDDSDNVVYAASLEAAKRAASDLTTKMEMKRKEILRRFGGKSSKSEKEKTFIETVTQLKFELGKASILMIINPDTLTLSEFTDLNRMLKEKHTAEAETNA